jgi:hypothetical protein
VRFLTAWLLLLTAVPAAGQTVTRPAAAAAGQIVTRPAAAAAGQSAPSTIRAVRLSEALRLDGVLDEALYSTEPPITGFLQTEPDEGRPATERTDVWVSFDREHVYVSFRCFETDASRMVANEMRRDSNAIWQGNDLVGFMFDTFHDRRNAVLFTANAIGGRQDGQVTNERQWNGDWNPVWEVQTGRFEGGWTVEAAIPFKSLRYRAGAQQTWGFNALRINRWKNEISLIVPGPSGQAQQGLQYSSIAPTLVGIEVPQQSVHLDAKPYIVSDFTSQRTLPSSVDDFGASIGLDVKYGITQNIAADLTVNTDFAQVEADEQQVNLTRFSLFFPEKREFFLENQGLFAFGGAATGGQSASASSTPILFYSRRIGLDENRIVPIRAGGRITGRVGRYSFGVLNIRTGQDDDDLEAPPSANFAVVRVKRDILRRSSVGVLVTDRSAGAIGGGRNLAYGIDGGFGFFANLSINTYWARTQTDGLTGDDTSYRGQFDYNGDRYGLQLERLAVGEDFKPEVGFVRRGNMRRTFGEARFSPRVPRIEWIRKLLWSGSIDYVENGTGLLETREQQGTFGIDFENSDVFRLEYTRTYEFLPRVFEISPGIELPVGSYDYSSVRVGYNIGQRRRVSAQLALDHGTFYSGHRTSVQISRGRVNVSSQLSLEPTYTLNRVTLAEGAFTSHLAGTRITYTMTPSMFASALVQYRSDSRMVSTNARLRWEYQPGSELFVVYNEERDTLGRSFPSLMNRAIIIKVNRLFRL